MRDLGPYLFEKQPDSVELRAYLAQYIGFIDKRNFIELSMQIEDFIKSRLSIETDLYDFILNQCSDVEITEILSEFKIETESIYFFRNDKDSYNEYYFESISRENRDCNELRISEYEVRDPEVNEQDFTENFDASPEEFTLADFPRLYRAIFALRPGDDCLFVMEVIEDEWYEIYNCKGENISEKLWQAYEAANSTQSPYNRDLECSRFNSIILGENNYVLASTAGRYMNWLLFEIQLDEIRLVDWDVTFSATYRPVPSFFVKLETKYAVKDFLRK